MKKTNDQAETALIEAIDEMKFYKELQPALQAALKYGAGSDKILRKSQALAVAKLIQLLKSDKEDVQLRAASQILDRALGKAIERKVNIYGDIENLNPHEIDAKIKRLLKKHDAPEVIDAIIESSVKKLTDGSDES
jgi:Xaa-Pro aminopeptidase